MLEKQKIEINKNALIKKLETTEISKSNSKPLEKININNPLEKKEDKPHILTEDPEIIAKYLRAPVELIKQISRSKYGNKLFPFILECAYNLVILRSHYIYKAEQLCDELIELFFEDKLKKVTHAEFLEEFKLASNTIEVKRQIMYRILIATFEIGYKKQDNLPPKLRKLALDFLKLDESITLSQSQTLLERHNKTCLIEELILGRMGYLLIWKDLAQGYEYVNTIKDEMKVVINYKTQVKEDIQKDESIQIIRKQIEFDCNGIPKNKAEIMNELGIEISYVDETDFEILQDKEDSNKEDSS